LRTNFDGHQVTEIRGNAELLEQGRQDRVDRLPTEEQQRSRSRIFEQHAQKEKDCSISETAQHDDQDISLKLFDTGSIEEVIPARRAEWQIGQCEVSHGGRNEEK